MAQTAKISAAKIIAELPRLSKSELKTVELAVRQLSTSENEIDEGLFSVISVQLNSRAPYSFFVKSRFYKSWLAGQANFADFVEDITAKKNLKKVQLLAVKRFLIQLIIEDLKTRNIRPTVGTVATSIGRIYDIFDCAYPGYIKAGHGDLVVKLIIGK